MEDPEDKYQGGTGQEKQGKRVGVPNNEKDVQVNGPKMVLCQGMEMKCVWIKVWVVKDMSIVFEEIIADLFSQESKTNHMDQYARCEWDIPP